ncbi:hypothetical protein CON65_15245 [Bacillus pseudomycoides]|uniref:Uncharacterized protein n=1 Tax=Bacillus pseudomycoides TaxID=64104 RepID=A0AA91ZTP3_9BACI|nr:MULTISPECIES: hypothetical protein [Bacillus]PEB51880.1 hypothetical protein COO03_14560 [Bacillus sp. AFS098217]PED81833.1 hypothetical protein CON65_15245 [Bacillus pseudomycoides]PEU15261.1 hypothetical protein CN525_17750 [Bacillus sp. AFS014408]PEU17864.1 hypothetical protein CN524_01015 [Bacillus sp. AFS019443]PFW63339.1 hypothetical protein COL20_09185 [Bacillus sp. AFS075034]
MNVLEAKRDLAKRTKRGLPVVLAGLIFWIIASIAGSILPEKYTVWVYLIGMGCVFPVGLMLAALLKIDMFAKGNPMGSLGGIIGAINVLNIPLVVFVYFQMPEWLPFTVAVLVGVHFLPYVWIYESKSYGLLSVGTVLVTSICGVLFSEKGFIVIPIAVTAVYVITIVGLSIENKKVGNQRNGKMTA